MRRHARPTPAAVARALEFQAIRPPVTARGWLVSFPDREPIERIYQHPVPLSRVLADHRAAVGADPILEIDHGK